MQNLTRPLPGRLTFFRPVRYSLQKELILRVFRNLLILKAQDVKPLFYEESAYTCPKYVIQKTSGDLRQTSEGYREYMQNSLLIDAGES